MVVIICLGSQKITCSFGTNHEFDSWGTHEYQPDKKNTVCPTYSFIGMIRGDDSLSPKLTPPKPSRKTN